MIEISLAAREDTTSVVRPVSGINSDGNRLLLDSSLKGRNGRRDISVTTKGVERSNDFSCLASLSLFSMIRIVLFSGDVRSLDVLESIVH